MDYLEQLARNYIQLPGQPSGTGWYPVLCKVCNDHGRKGPRAAFRFEPGSIAYHCFNCGHKATYKNDYNAVPDKMIMVFSSFGVPDDEIKKLHLHALQEKHSSSKTEKVKENLSITPIELSFPDHFYLLSEATEKDKWAEIARYYLEDKRAICPSDYNFYLSTGIPKKFDGPPSQKQTFVKAAQKWAKRLIIPIYKDKKLIYYQGRDLTGTALKKYESPSASKDRVLYGFDQLFSNENKPLYVFEGFFDAFHIQGIALLGNELTEPQMLWLNKSRRDKVYVPDKGVSGEKNALKAIDQGWRISTPEIGNCKDINEAIVKYGQIYVHNTLRENTHEGELAKAPLSFYCK